MSMHYIKFILLVLVLLTNACSQSPIVQGDLEGISSDNSSPQQQLAETDLTNYKSALYAMRDDNLELAESLLKNIIENHPEIAGPYANLGIIYYKKESYKKALKVLEEALKLNPRNAYVHNTLALTHQRLSHYPLAEKHFLLAINNKNDYAIAHYNIALLYDIFFHKIEDSISHYKIYISLLHKNAATDKKTADWLEQLENSMKKG